MIAPRVTTATSSATGSTSPANAICKARRFTHSTSSILGCSSPSMYLDRYFRDAEELLDSLNQAQLQRSTDEQGGRDQMEPFTRSDLNKLAFWMATGSGKTLLMHCHIRQYLALPGQSGQAAGLKPHHPAHAKRRAFAPAQGGVRAVRHRGRVLRQRRRDTLHRARRGHYRHSQTARNLRREDGGGGYLRG